MFQQFHFWAKEFKARFYTAYLYVHVYSNSSHNN